MYRRDHLSTFIAPSKISHFLSLHHEGGFFSERDREKEKERKEERKEERKSLALMIYKDIFLGTNALRAEIYCSPPIKQRNGKYWQRALRQCRKGSVQCGPF